MMYRGVWGIEYINGVYDFNGVLIAVPKYRRGLGLRSWLPFANELTTVYIA
jgi:hypothetical protein